MISRKLRIILVASLFTISTTSCLYFFMAMVVFYKIPESNYWNATSWPGDGFPIILTAFFGLSAIGVWLAVENDPKVNKNDS